MPAVHITYTIDQTIPAPNAFTVEFRVIDVQNIDAAIFVFDSAYQAYTGVATPFDMRTWPAVRDANLMSFRAPGVVRTYATIEEAEYFIDVTKGRIAALQEAWQTYLNDFEAHTVVVLP
jgi:hypothetical protein